MRDRHTRFDLDGTSKVIDGSLVHLQPGLGEASIQVRMGAPSIELDRHVIVGDRLLELVDARVGVRSIQVATLRVVSLRYRVLVRIDIRSQIKRRSIGSPTR